MKISGFTFIKNATKLYLPFKESLQSLLPIVDELVIAVGDNDPDDGTMALIDSLKSDKIKLIPTVWDYQKYPKGTEFAHQTDIAKEGCSGDWLFYLQGDEVIHEQDHATISEKLKLYYPRKEVEAMHFKYFHFYGDYSRYQIAHGWYKNEIRIIRNDPDVHSWRDAQSFRRIPNFDGKDYHQSKGTFKLRSVPIDVPIYHYGWVRPPMYLLRKKLERAQNYHRDIEHLKKAVYGPLGSLATFKGTHPAVMKDWIDRFDWAHELNYTTKSLPDDENFKHTRLKNRVLTFIEQNILGGRGLGEFKNYIELRP